MGHERETPRETAKRKQTIEAVSGLIAELESKADAEEKAAGAGR